MRSLRSWIVACIAIVALTAVAVLWLTRDSDEEKARKTVRGFVIAFVDGDGQEACTKLSGEAERRFREAAVKDTPRVAEGRTCAEIVELLARETTAADRAQA